MNPIKEIEMRAIADIENKRRLPIFTPGDDVRVHLKITEGGRERIQLFEGVCIAIKRAGINSSFTVRKISHGEAVERLFPFYSPRIAALDIVRRGKVRRAKLYYLRGLRGKRARIARQTTGYAAKLDKRATQ